LLSEINQKISKIRKKVRPQGISLLPDQQAQGKVLVDVDIDPRRQEWCGLISATTPFSASRRLQPPVPSSHLRARK
jgi:hypothetical protein